MVHHYKCKCKTQSIMFCKGILDSKITQKDTYCYLWVTIHKSGKIKYAVEDRIKGTSQSINMLQGALSSCGNINVNVAMSLFEQ